MTGREFDVPAIDAEADEDGQVVDPNEIPRSLSDVEETFLRETEER